MVAAAAEERDDDIDLRDVAATLWARRLWIVAKCVLVYRYLLRLPHFMAEPVYRAATVLADARADTGVSTLSAALGALGNIGNVARTEYSRRHLRGRGDGCHEIEGVHRELRSRSATSCQICSPISGTSCG